jgi:hypothetical protein
MGPIFNDAEPQHMIDHTFFFFLFFFFLFIYLFIFSFWLWSEFPCIWALVLLFKKTVPSYWHCLEHNPLYFSSSYKKKLLKVYILFYRSNRIYNTTWLIYINGVTLCTQNKILRTKWLLLYVPWPSLASEQSN